MITLPRPLARQFRAVLRRCLHPPGPRYPPLVRLRPRPDGLEMSTLQQECSLLYRQAGSFPPTSLNFPADVLADIEGKSGSATLAATEPGKGEARWDDGGVPRTRSFDTVVSEGLPELPRMPARLTPFASGFLHALAEAVRTTARDGARYALTRIQLRGKTGQVVATDGRQLLLQGGFSFPWTEDLLVPALPLFASRDLPSEDPIAIGRTTRHVGLRIGPWTIHLEIDSGGRFPDTDGVIPRTDTMPTRLHLCEEDADVLSHVLSRLPGSKEHLSPITLDLGKQVVVRAKGDESPQASEVVLFGSSCQGPPVRVACNRHFLRRVVQLGFREVRVRNATTPLLCRDETRIYLFMPLDNALPPAADVVRIVSGESASDPVRLKSKPEPERRREPMPRPPTPEDPPRNGTAHGASPSRTPSEPELPDPLAEAEALRSLLHEAQAHLARLLAALKQQRRQTRALRSAVDSLRNLRLDR